MTEPSPEVAKSPESESQRLQHKCTDLKQKILELEHQNELRTVAISRAKNSVKRLRFEYAVLLECLEKKALSLGIADAERLTADDLDKDSVDSLRLADITQLLMDTPWAVANTDVPTVGLDAIRNGLENGIPGMAGHAGNGKKRRGGTGAAARRRAKDPDMPKRPTNAYLIFCDLGKDQVRQQWEENHPGISTDMSKAMTEAWRAMDDEARKPYYILYEKDKERYHRELDEYTERKKREAAASVAREGSASNLGETDDEEEDEGGSSPKKQKLSQEPEVKFEPSDMP